MIVAIFVLRIFNRNMLAKKLEDDFAVLSQEVLPDKVSIFAPYIGELDKVLVALATKHKLDLDSRLKLRQNLIDWLDDKLSKSSNYPIELAKMGFEIHGERTIQELEPKTTRMDESHGLREPLEIIDDTSGSIKKL